MITHAPLTAHKSLNKAYRKVKPTRSQIDLFKTNLVNLFDGVKEGELEEYHKNLVSQFLLNSYYHDRFFINTKERTDLAIYNGKEASSTAGVIIEAKKPSNKAEMISGNDLNRKAMHELILYFLRERITKENKELKQIIATNIYQWYIFDATVFDKLFAQNKELARDFKEFESKRLSGYNTDYFYKEIAAPFLENLETTIPYTYIDLHQFEKAARSKAKENDQRLIALYKIFSPEHLLKLPFANDSNSLDKGFYNELLHLIGLEEVKEGSKKVIGRKKQANRDKASLLENAITVLDGDGCLSAFPQKERFGFGATKEEQLYNLALELVITWINRVLFMKLLEGQLTAYHKGSGNDRFLNSRLIGDFDELNKLFFRVLALPEKDRTEEINAKYGQVPYLNSSLFETTPIEQKSIRISNLDNALELPVLPATVLKNQQGKKLKGKLNTLQYLFLFLDAYDFASEGTEDIQDESKTLINASVLGLIFEKINGYKDGSFFTPGFITMYMCRETIRQAVVQKFNDSWNWTCNDFSELKEDLTAEIRQSDKGREAVRRQANELINNLHICDPAVGSGHFLVSALNELIAIKSELQILTDRQGQPLNAFNIEIVNDELMVTDLDENLFEYRPGNRESQRMQESLFHEKQTLIENCLFGVDINSNSVKICRLRLWIELLKNAYYRTDGKLETLPNIDINIKCGNSLISRYALDANITKALKDQKMSVDAYRKAVSSYRHAKSKDEKRTMEELILRIKQNITSEIRRNDPLKKKYDKLSHELYNRFTGNFLFESETDYGDKSKKRTKKAQKEQASLEKEMDIISKKMDEIRNNEIFANPLEWRFEFPEVLDDDGNFIGFDVVIGNPPYIRQEEFTSIKDYLQANFSTYSGTADLYVYFVERGLDIAKRNAQFVYILPNKWLRAGYGKALRNWIRSYNTKAIIDFGDLPVFEEATTYPCIWHIQKHETEQHTFKTTNVGSLHFPKGLDKYIAENSFSVNRNYLSDDGWSLADDRIQQLIAKIKQQGKPLGEYVNGNIYRGVLTGCNEAFVIDGETRDQLIEEDESSAEIIKPFLAGRDIKRYQKPSSDKYLIFTRRGIDIDSYPAIKRYLEQFQKSLEPKPKDYKGKNWPGRKPGKYKWYEIQDSVDYYGEFEKEKIIIPAISNKANFCLDIESYYSNDKTSIIPTYDIALLGLMNSKLLDFFVKSIASTKQNGYFEYKPVYISQIPIYPPTGAFKDKILENVTLIMEKKKNSSIVNTNYLESEIDLLVYKLYNLTWEEVKLVDPEFELSEEDYVNFKIDDSNHPNEITA